MKIKIKKRPSKRKIIDVTYGVCIAVIGFVEYRLIKNAYETNEEIYELSSEIDEIKDKREETKENDDKKTDNEENSDVK